VKRKFSREYKKMIGPVVLVVGGMVLGALIVIIVWKIHSKVKGKKNFQGKI
jgi:hypothetical protein